MGMGKNDPKLRNTRARYGPPSTRAEVLVPALIDSNNLRLSVATLEIVLKPVEITRKGASSCIERVDVLVLVRMHVHPFQYRVAFRRRLII